MVKEIIRRLRRKWNRFFYRYRFLGVPTAHSDRRFAGAIPLIPAVVLSFLLTVAGWAMQKIGPVWLPAHQSLLFKKGSFTSNTGTPPFDQAVTGVGLGAAGKAIIFFWTPQTAEGTAANAEFGVGMAVSASAEGAMAVDITDNVTTTIAKRAYDSTRSIFSNAPGFDAEFKSFDGADGNFTVTWQTNPGAGRIIQYIVIGGADLTAQAVTEINLNASAGNQSYAHGLGATPDFMFCVTVNHTATAGAQAHATMAIGWAVSDSKRGSVSINASDAETMEANQDQMRVLASDRCLICMGNSVPTVAIELDFVSWDGTNVTFNQINAPTLNTDLLCLFLAGGQYDAGSFAARTTVGSDNFTVAFTPKGVGLMMAQGITNGTLHTVTADANMAFGAGSSTDGTQEGSVSVASTDAIEPTQADQRTVTTKVITSLVDGAPGSVDGEADLTALGTTSTIDWTDAPGTADIVLWFAMGDAAVAADELTGGRKFIGVP